MGNQGEVEIEASLRDRRMGTLRKNTPQLERQPGTPDRTRSVLPEGGVVKANCGQGLKPLSESIPKRWVKVKTPIFQIAVR